MKSRDPQPALDDLIQLHLHGLAGDLEQQELGRHLADSPRSRRRFLDQAALHALLAVEARCGSFAEDRLGFFREIENRTLPRKRARVHLWLSAAASAALAFLVIMPLLPAPASGALDQVISRFGQTQDLSYRIEVLEEGSSANELPGEDRGRFPVGRHLHGATIWIRGERCFVLKQALPNGETRYLGSNGAASWSRRGEGPVRLSGDPERFGGGVVSKGRELALADLNHQLRELKAFYQIDWLDRPGKGVWKLRGTRKSASQGGAKDIELWFDPEKGLLLRMILRQLPQAGGGPRGIAFVLQSTTPLAPDFFEPSYPRLQSP